MRDILLRVVTNPTVRKAFVALVIAVAAALGFGFSSGCGLASLPPAVAKARDVLACQIAALETVVPLSAAEDIAMAARAGNNEYAVRQLLGLGLTPAAISAAADLFGACSDEQDNTPTAPAMPEIIRS